MGKISTACPFAPPGIHRCVTLRISGHLLGTVPFQGYRRPCFHRVGKGMSLDQIPYQVHFHIDRSLRSETVRQGTVTTYKGNFSRFSWIINYYCSASHFCFGCIPFIQSCLHHSSCPSLSHLSCGSSTRLSAPALGGTSSSTSPLPLAPTPGLVFATLCFSLLRLCIGVTDLVVRRTRIQRAILFLHTETHTISFATTCQSSWPDYRSCAQSSSSKEVGAF